MFSMEKNHINQVQLSAATGIAVSRINNYLHGKYRTIRPDHLELLCKSASRTDAERRELIRTYLIDLLPEGLQGDIQLGGGRDGTRSGVRNPVKLERALLPTATAAAMADLHLLVARSAKARNRLEWFVELLRDAGRN